MSEHQEQPMPTEGTGPDIQRLVLTDMRARYALGVGRYGRGVQVGNGRDMLRDLYEELLDAAVYARGLMAERDGFPVEEELVHDAPEGGTGEGRKVADFYEGLSLRHLDELGKALEAAIGEPLAFKGPGLQVWTMT